MKSNEQNKLINKIETDSENSLTAVRRKGVGWVGEKGEGIKQKEKQKKEKTTHRDK